MSITVKCPICGEIYEDIDDTWQNQLVHCEHCGKEFKTERYFIPPPKPIFLIKLECPTCKKIFDSEGSDINKSYTCPHCGNIFFSMRKYSHDIVEYFCPVCHAKNIVSYTTAKNARDILTCIICSSCHTQYRGNQFYLSPIKPKDLQQKQQTIHPTHDNSKAVYLPPVVPASHKDAGIYILLALLFGGFGAHNIYAEEYDKFIVKLIISGVILAFLIGVLANQPTVEVSEYTYRVVTHTPDGYVFCLVGLCIAAIINAILILADIICANDNCKGNNNPVL